VFQDGPVEAFFARSPSGSLRPVSSTSHKMTAEAAD
jgi:hypothetical protein